jgi:ElaB/YqjD/DUF883 family membrane-anchored ribosome-binding protein
VIIGVSPVSTAYVRFMQPNPRVGRSFPVAAKQGAQVMAQASYKPQDYTGSTDPKDRVSEATDKAMGQMDRLSHSAQEQAHQVSDNMRMVANNLDTAVRRSIREQPMTTLAMAAALGFVLGAIWKS